MSAPEASEPALSPVDQPRSAAGSGLLVLIDPVARRLDGESVRIARDVLCAGAPAKVCVPEGPTDFARALARRGGRRTVVVGDDGALVRTVALLHRERDLGADALALVPVGAPSALSLARSLGVAGGAVAAARAVLDGAVRSHDLLVDDSDGVVLGGLRIPEALGTDRPASGGPRVWGACRSLVRTLVPGPGGRGEPPRGQRLRVEADGVVLSDLDRPVRDVSVATGGGVAEVVVRSAGRAGPALTARASSVTVSGPDFRYRADHQVSGPVRSRTWELWAGAWGLTVPR
ncbi:diacylglycerol kinase [Streptomyces sp. NPDC006879]|uniref:diacylglycerol kinase n=1 Tax=Streptomyces sp. NPDC006879 TaxID=3364767 RepID=UPI0036B64446